MRYPEQMKRPLGDDDREWLKANNRAHLIEQFDAEDGQTPAQDYYSMNVADLKAEIERRNEEIEADDEKLSLDGKKADLIKTLEADDEALANSEA